MNTTSKQTIFHCHFLKRRLSVTILLACLTLLYIQAQDRVSPVTSRGWYVGIDGGLPFGFSTFSSFGHDKTRVGWVAGVYGGYRFNPILSAELSAKYGEVNLAAQKCCVEQGYWLGSDGTLYKAGVLGMDSWEYADLKSRVQMGQYGARLNVNVLGFFHKIAQSRWELAISPHVYAISTRAKILTISDGMHVQNDPTNWHLGYGVDLQLNYQLTSCLRLGIYSGLTRINGSRIDGMPEYLHENNYVWESGLRIGFCLSKKKHAIKEPSFVPKSTELPQKENTSSVVTSQEELTNKAETTITSPQVAKQVRYDFPVIYFDFNSTRIKQKEESKLYDILKLLQNHDDANVTITGWCDMKGSTEVNRRISLKRAQVVKEWLVNNGIDANRITTIGNGSDGKAMSPDKARRAETTNNNSNQ